MLQVKLFEVRDRGTFIPAIGISTQHVTPINATTIQEELYLLRRSGYGQSPGERCIIFTKLAPCASDQAHYDEFGWKGGARTMQAAHQYVVEHWDNLKSGDVIDVEFIAGETPEPKQSERLTS